MVRMTPRQWSLVVVLILVNYLIFSQLFSRIINNPPRFASATRTPEATFTPSPTLVVPVITPQVTPTPIPADPTATPTLVIMTDEQARIATITVAAQTAAAAGPQEPPTATPTPAPQSPQVTAGQGAVNLRSGPGTNYTRVGVLPAGESLGIVGRNPDSTWWQVNTADGLRWIAASVTTSSGTGDFIQVVETPVPPPPPPTNTPAPQAPAPAPAGPQAQYSLTNVFGEVNEAITQIRGYIQDGNGNAVNGVRVRVRSGSFCTISYPSGPPGGYPPGNYDILLDNRAKAGQWEVAVVNGPADPTNTQCGSEATLSEEVTVPTGPVEGVSYVEWRKNF